jgi:P-type Ca2+ transporter type 2C
MLRRILLIVTFASALTLQVVGDILILNAGDRVPTDGLLVDGSDVTCNESALTGESDDKKKSLQKEGGAEAEKEQEQEEAADVFMLSGSSLATGYAHVLVTAVGEQSRWGKTKAKLAAETVDTPLQEKLDVLAGQIGNLGMGAAAATFVAMLAIWYAYPEQRDPSLNIYEYVLKAFIMAVTIVVVAVPEGLPLAVTLSLAYSTQKMMLDNNLIRVLAACETMGNATNICSDKTGTLTQNRMTVVQGWVAGHFYAAAPPSRSELPAACVELICEGIAVNSTANVAVSKVAGELPIVNGNKTEGALLMMMANDFQTDYISLRTRFNAARGDRLFTFSSARKRMSVLLANGKHGGAKSGICYTKGAAEIIVGCCDKYMDARGEEKKLTPAVRAELLAAIAGMAKNALRAIALAHRTVATVSTDLTTESLETGMTIDGIFGIKDPLRPDVKEAVQQCQEAGIFVRMVTGDNIDTAKAIATECGILTDGGIAMEGPAFRKLTPAQLDAVLPHLQVLARSSPDDKHTLVTRLNGTALPEDEAAWQALHPEANWATDRALLLPGYREEWTSARPDGVGEVVGVTGDGTNDGPALKAADVGLSMGLTGTDGRCFILVPMQHFWMLFYLLVLCCWSCFCFCFCFVFLLVVFSHCFFEGLQL